MQIAEQKDELTSFANPKSASFTDPFAWTNILAHFISLDMKQFFQLIEIIVPNGSIKTKKDTYPFVWTNILAHVISLDMKQFFQLTEIIVPNGSIKRIHPMYKKGLNSTTDNNSISHL
jgi:hypothetical protein